MNQRLQEMQGKLEPLLHSIQEGNPGGIDLSVSYLPLYEQINEARRADNPSLSLGEWEVPLKVADWDKVRQFCEKGLREHSKDLQLAAWYAEAMTHLKGFAGAASGLRLTEELLRRFQDSLYPNDPDERIGKLEWLSSQLGATLRQVALTKPEQGSYNWYHWEESRSVENMRRRGKDEYDNAIKEGKLSGEVFDKSTRESGIDWYRALLDDLAEAQTAHNELVILMEECFGDNAPSFAEIRQALSECQDVSRRLFELCGGRSTAASSTTSPLPSESQANPDSSSRPFVSAAGPVTSRVGAVHQLREISRYFREHEPHSPVALLVDRAAKWAEMPLEHWLKAVIKDEPTLKQLRELLDFNPD